MDRFNSRRSPVAFMTTWMLIICVLPLSAEALYRDSGAVTAFGCMVAMLLAGWIGVIRVEKARVIVNQARQQELAAITDAQRIECATYLWDLLKVYLRKHSPLVFLRLGPHRIVLCRVGSQEVAVYLDDLARLQSAITIGDRRFWLGDDPSKADLLSISRLFTNPRDLLQVTPGTIAKLVQAQTGYVADEAETVEKRCPHLG